MCLTKVLSLEFSKQRKTKKVGRIYDDPTKISKSTNKEPGPDDSLKYCAFTWNKERSTFYLYQNHNSSLTSVEKGKFLLAARKFKYPSHIEFVISLDANDFSKESDSYVGKLSSDYMGINFTIYENRPLSNDAVATKQISPTLPNNFKVGEIYYEFDELESQGLKNFVHSIRCPSGVNNSKNKALRNATPKWHEDLQCLCFEFKYKAVECAAGEEDEENINRLKSKRVGNDTSALAYRYPYSTLQAFAIRISTCRDQFPLK